MDHEDSAEVASLRERLSTLSEASLRISESLDYDTVLPGVLDSARALTHARYGVITVLDDAGGIEEFLSSGFTPEEEERLWGLPENAGLIEHLGEVPGPLRLADFRGHLQALGLPDSQLPVEASVIPFLPVPLGGRGAEAIVSESPEGGGQARRPRSRKGTRLADVSLQQGHARWVGRF